MSPLTAAIAANRFEGGAVHPERGMIFLVFSDSSDNASSIHHVSTGLLFAMRRLLFHAKLLLKCPRTSENSAPGRSVREQVG